MDALTAAAPSDSEGTCVPRPAVLPFLDPRLAHAPGLQPLDPDAWLLRDAAFSPQMALRDRLVATRREDVHVLLPEGEAAAAELLAVLRSALGLPHGATEVLRADGIAVPLSGSPLLVAGRLVQEDFLLLLRTEGEAEHRLVGGILCFPARWTLAEKMARGLVGIHAPVPDYPQTLAPRVQRVFDAVRPGRPLWRANWLVHDRPDLFQPGFEARKAPRDFSRGPLWLRVERQTLLRLPASGAVAFGIKTDVAPLGCLSAEEGRALVAAVAGLPTAELAYKGGAPLLARLRAEFPG